MSFLDNLENNLKALEGREEMQTQRDLTRREAERAQAVAVAPHAEKLRNAPFTAELLTQATRIGREQRLLVRPAWLGNTLRLEARDRKLELRPTAEGVVAVYLEGSEEIRREPVDLAGSPEPLVRQWLA
jgi:hypothetical protein